MRRSSSLTEAAKLAALGFEDDGITLASKRTIRNDDEVGDEAELEKMMELMSLSPYEKSSRTYDENENNNDRRMPDMRAKAKVLALTQSKVLANQTRNEYRAATSSRDIITYNAEKIQALRKEWISCEKDLSRAYS